MGPRHQGHAVWCLTLFLPSIINNCCLSQFVKSEHENLNSLSPLSPPPSPPPPSWQCVGAGAAVGWSAARQDCGQHCGVLLSTGSSLWWCWDEVICHLGPGPRGQLDCGSGSPHQGGHHVNTPHANVSLTVSPQLKFFSSYKKYLVSIFPKRCYFVVKMGLCKYKPNCHSVNPAILWLYN